jgi:hypothetical protein
VLIVADLARDCQPVRRSPPWRRYIDGNVGFDADLLDF